MSYSARILLVFSVAPCGILKQFDNLRTRTSNWCITTVSGSTLTHVAISNGTNCFSPGLYRRLYYKHDEYIQLPNVVFIIEFPPLVKYDIDGFGTDDNLVPIWRSALKWLTLGLVKTDDCVCITKKVLARAGYNVPRSVWSPRQLFEWITTNAEHCRIEHRSHFFPRLRDRTHPLAEPGVHASPPTTD